MKKCARWIIAGFVRIVQGASLLFGRKNGTKMLALLAERLAPVVSVPVKHGTLRFGCVGALTVSRAYSLLTKEPDTIDWIDQMTPGALLWDIGANVGVYTLYAGRRGLKISAFEPAAVNYHLLNRNIALNGLDGQVSAYCIAFNDVTCIDAFILQNSEPGAALNSFGSGGGQVGVRQAMMGFSVDDFVRLFAQPVPDYIKIDVDGNEPKILSGALKTLAHPTVKSVLVELPDGMSAQSRDFDRIFADLGYAPRSQSAGSRNIVFNRCAVSVGRIS